MPLTPAQALLAAGLPVALAALILAGLYQVLRRAGYRSPQGTAIRVGLAVGGWLALTGVIAASGFLSDFDARPPRMLFVVGPAVIGTVVLAHSRWLGTLLQHIPIAWPIAAQSFRVLVELMLWWVFSTGLIPEQMTFEGLNFDVVSGLLAIPVAYGLTRLRWPRGVAIAYNVLGLLLLFNIVTVALLSVPGPFRVFMNEPANTLPASFPFVWLPAFLVPAALFFHLVSLIHLRRARASG